MSVYRTLEYVVHLVILTQQLAIAPFSKCLDTYLSHCKLIGYPDHQAGFRPGRSWAGQLLDLTQHIEDGYERKMLTWRSICRPISCVRHSSTQTNDKKAGGHDWRHRSMPGDSRPPQQSPLLCTAK